MKKAITFLKALALHNDREWFNANKDKYLKVKEDIDNLAERLITLVAEIDPTASRFRASDVTYRIYRDARFSKDKSPYKTHIGIFINPPSGKKSMRCGYYFHIEPDHCAIFGGNMPLSGSLTKAIRQSIYNDIDEYLSIVESPEFKHYFPLAGWDFLKTTPKDFPKEWEYIDYIRPKSFGVEMNVADDFFDKRDLDETLRPILRQIKRYNDFINFTIDEAE